MKPQITEQSFESARLPFRHAPAVGAAGFEPAIPFACRASSAGHKNRIRKSRPSRATGRLREYKSSVRTRRPPSRSVPN